MRGFRVYLSVVCLATIATAQDRPPPEKPAPIPIPADVFLSDLREAYSEPFAEEVLLRVRTPAGDRADTLTIRVDPGPKPPDPAATTGPHPRAVLLELGQLRIHIAESKLTAINTAAPDKFYQRSFSGPITTARLAELIPPLPLPQLAIVNPDDPKLATPLDMLKHTAWADATVDENSRPQTLTIRGTSHSGTITLTALVSTVRLTRASASIRQGETELQLEFTFRAVEPGDVSKWALPIEGRESVESLTALKTTPRPLPPPAATDPVPTPAPTPVPIQAPSAEPK